MSKVVSFQPLRSVQSLSRGLGEEVRQAIPSFERDPRAKLIDMRLGGDLAKSLAARLTEYGLALEPDTVRDRYTPIERQYTRVVGREVDLGLLNIAPWIIAEPWYLSALQEIRSAFRKRRLRFVAKERDAGSSGLDPMLREWQRQDEIEARLVPWGHLQEVLDGLYPVTQILDLDLEPLPPEEVAAAAERAPLRAVPAPEEPAPLVFVSYSHDDTAWMRRLEDQIEPLARQGGFRLWTDEGIEPGDLWEEKIEAALDEAQAAVLLVSDSFLVSKFIQDAELPRLLEAARRREGFRILWVYLEACNYEATEIRRYQATHKTDDGRLVALQALPEREVPETLKRISRAIRDAVVSDDEE